MRFNAALNQHYVALMQHYVTLMQHYGVNIKQTEAQFLSLSYQLRLQAQVKVYITSQQYINISLKCSKFTNIGKNLTPIFSKYSENFHPDKISKIF